MGRYQIVDLPLSLQRNRFSGSSFSVANCCAAGAHFLTVHNVFYQLDLMAQVRHAIKEDRFSNFVKTFFNSLYHGHKSSYPQWAVDALRSVGIDLIEEIEQ
jgi:hypothetical protein